MAENHRKKEMETITEAKKGRLAWNPLLNGRFGQASQEDEVKDHQ